MILPVLCKFIYSCCFTLYNAYVPSFSKEFLSVSFWYQVPCTAPGFSNSFRLPTKFNKDKNFCKCERMYESLRKCFEHKPVYFDGTFFLLQKSIQIVRLFNTKVYFLCRIIFAITIAAINRTKEMYYGTVFVFCMKSQSLL